VALALLVVAAGAGVRWSLAPLAAAETAGALEPLTLVTGTGSEKFQVELADTDATRSEGLMYRARMDADKGMLFDFKREQNVYFWMKNTYLPLDMIFIKADGTITHIKANTVPLSENTVPSESSVRFVLEVNAGTSQRIGLKPGDHVIHRLVRGKAD
jgi:uncharacterized protein